MKQREHKRVHGLMSNICDRQIITIDDFRVFSNLNDCVTDSKCLLALRYLLASKHGLRPVGQCEQAEKTFLKPKLSYH